LLENLLRDSTGVVVVVAVVAVVVDRMS